MWIMGRRIVLAFTMALTLCSAEFTFPTDADVIRPFTLEESRYMIDKVNAYRSNVSRIPGDLCHMHYDYDDEQTAAECTQEYDNNHWCYYHLHYSAHNHQTRQFKLDFTQFPTLESVMESFQQTAELFDVSTGKPDDTWSEKFYAVMISSFPDTMSCGLRIVTASKLVIIHCLFSNTLDAYQAVHFGDSYTPSEKPCGLCPGIPCVNNLCKPDVRWLARGIGSAYDASLAREIEEAALAESISIYPCLIAPFISLAMAFFF